MKTRIVAQPAVRHLIPVGQERLLRTIFGRHCDDREFKERGRALALPALEEAYFGLPEDEQGVARLRMGLDGEAPLRHPDIASKMEITVDQVEKLDHQANMKFIVAIRRRR